MTIIGNAITVGGLVNQLTVTAPEGSTITVTDDISTFVKTGGTVKFRLPRYGTWTVTAQKGSEAAPQTIITQGQGVIMSYKPVASLAPKSGVTYTNGISGITPEKMSLYGEAISNNASITKDTSVVYIDEYESHYKLSVGDAINLTVSGATYELVMIGFNHDDLTDASAYGMATATGKAGMTLQMLNCLATTYTMNSSNTNANDWNGCAFRTTLQGTIKNSMDKLLDNGSFGLCGENEAEGIAAGGAVYHVCGRPPIAGVGR